MTGTAFAPRLHGEGHQVEESAELEQATRKHSEVPANAVSRRTARLSASAKIWQRLFLRVRDASRDGKETQPRATMGGRLTPPEHDHDGIARE